MKTLFIAIVVLAFSNPAHGQSVIDTTDQQRTVDISIQELLNPSLQPYQEISPINTFQYDKPIKGTVRSLLILGTDLIWGDDEKYSIYSFENSWRYPGATVKYPQTANELDLFIKRYKKHNPDQ